MRVVSGSVLAESSDLDFVISDSPGGMGETFRVQLAPTISFPSGLQLADLYVDPTQSAVITIDDQEYLLNDGTRVATSDQVDVDLLAGLPAGTTLSSLSADQVAATVAAAIEGSPAGNPVVPDFYFSDPSDDPNVPSGRNDLIYEATPLPYNGGNLTITGTGRLGSVDDPLQPPTNLDDVDLVATGGPSGHHDRG